MHIITEEGKPLKMNRFKKVFEGKMRKIQLLSISLIITTIFIVGGFLIYDYKTVTVDIDGQVTIIGTFEDTVKSAFDQKSILVDAKDKMDHDLNSKLSRHDKIIIHKAVEIVLNRDGKEEKIKSAEKNIAEMLAAEGIFLSPIDKVLPNPTEEISKDLCVNVIRVTNGVIKEKQEVNYQNLVNHDANLLETQSKVLQVGQNGEKEITYNVTYENGIEVKREATQQVLTKEPVNEVVLKGSLPVFLASRGEGGGISFSREVLVKTTAYYAVYGVGKTYTASGMKAVRNPYGYSTVAVDPSIFPYGTKLFIEGYGYAIAGDTGTSIKGDIIDVFFDTYGEACAWGVKYLRAYVIK